jgi:serine/threonine-protein kinase HipA
MKSRLDTVQAHVDLEHSGRPVLMGELHCLQSRTGEIFSFKYDEAWLARAEVFAFDPDLSPISPSLLSAIHKRSLACHCR